MLSRSWRLSTLCDSDRRTCLNFLWGELTSMYFHGSWRCPGQLPHLPSPIATCFGITAAPSPGSLTSRFQNSKVWEGVSPSSPGFRKSEPQISMVHICKDGKVHQDRSLRPL